jgi:hypothetical protein
VDEEEDEEEEDEEEEEEEGAVHGLQQPNQQRQTRHHLRLPTPVQSTRTCPTSVVASRTIAHTVQMNAPSPLSIPGGKVRMVRQWTPRMEVWAGTAHV